MMRYKIILGIMMMSVMFTGCGQKKMPRIVDTGKPPHVESLKYEVTDNNMSLTFMLRGGTGNLGYQIDRAEINPHCDCPGFWRRFIDRKTSPRQANTMLVRSISLRASTAYVFRIRAVDNSGNLGAWSKLIRVHAEEMSK